VSTEPTERKRWADPAGGGVPTHPDGQGDLQASLLPLCGGRRVSNASREGRRKGRGSTGACTHGEAPADVRWGRVRESSQHALRSLCASVTLEEAAEPLRRPLPFQLSACQALHVMQLLADTLQQQEEEQVRTLWDQRRPGPAASETRHDRMDRLSLEGDGVLAQVRRGSGPMEELERTCKGEEYRKVRSSKPPAGQNARGWHQVCGDHAGQKHAVACRGKAEDGGQWLCPGRLPWAAAGVPDRGLRRWGCVDLARGGRTPSRGRAHRGQLADTGACLEGSSSGLWITHTGGTRPGSLRVSCVGGEHDGRSRRRGRGLPVSPTSAGNLAPCAEHRTGLLYQQCRAWSFGTTRRLP